MIPGIEMAETDNQGAGTFWRILRILGLSLALVALAGVAAGFTIGWNEHHDGIGLKFVLVLGGIALVAAGCGWLLWREFNRPGSHEPLTRNERLNRNILIACGALGGIVGAVLAVADGGKLTEGGGVFSNEPLPPMVAAALIFVLGILIPIISYYWHKVVDEQEVHAYKTGTLYAFYLYGIGTPIWWLAWRGGFAPAPDGFVIYYATITVMAIVWLWKKYG